jgi:hypothetical protein
MIIYGHNYKNITVLELEENEITLIAYLLEKSHQKLNNKMENSLSTILNEKMQTFLKEEI